MCKGMKDQISLVRYVLSAETATVSGTGTPITFVKLSSTGSQRMFHTLNLGLRRQLFCMPRSYLCIRTVTYIYIYLVLISIRLYIVSTLSAPCMPVCYHRGASTNAAPQRTHASRLACSAHTALIPFVWALVLELQILAVFRRNGLDRQIGKSLIRTCEPQAFVNGRVTRREPGAIAMTTQVTTKWCPRPLTGSNRGFPMKKQQQQESAT